MLAYFKDQKQAMIDEIIELVNYETPSRVKFAVDALGAVMAEKLQHLGAHLTHFPQSEVGDLLLATWNAEAEGKPILFLVHIDTVWDIGTLTDFPVRIEDGLLYGPGVVDMKGGIVVMLSAIRGLIAQGQLPNRPIQVLMNTDEEIGSRHSQHLIQDIARNAALVLVMEPGTPEGALKTWRKGIATYRVYVEGQASHAGNRPEQGINAIIELSQQILKLHALNDLKYGTSVSTTLIEGGSAGNVIPANASAYLDTRFMHAQAMDKIAHEVMNLYPFTPGAKVWAEAVHHRPPMEHNALMRQTYERAKTIAQAHGITLREEGSGGGSDGNFTAAMDIPTLDGLGPQGDGLHARHEQVVISSLATRAALIAALLQTW